MFKLLGKKIFTFFTLKNVAYLDPCFLISDENQEGVMDNLLEALKTGSAFNVVREKRDGKRRTPRAAGGI